MYAYAELDVLRGAKMAELSNEIASVRAILTEKDKTIAHFEWSLMQKQSMDGRK